MAGVYMAGRTCMAGGHAWQGACMVREHAWQGACVVVGGMHGRGACMPWQIPWDTVNEWVVRILLECILVIITFIKNIPEPVRSECSALGVYEKKFSL